MVISKGEPWGAEIVRPGDVPVASSDAALASYVAERGHGEYALSGGDVYASLGRPRPNAVRAQRLPMDVLRVDTDREHFVAVAHVVARKRFWRGRIVGAFNVGRLGAWDVAPAAHPNDGRFELIEVDEAMTWRDRMSARRRLPSGGHVPHPSIRLRHAREATWTFDEPVRCVADGIPRGTITSLTVSIEPDAFELIV